MSNKFQNEDFKSESELVSAGGTKAQLLNDTKIYVTANGINKTLDDAIIDGDLGGGGGVGGTDILLAQTADDAVLGDFTQNNLEIVTSPILHGTKSFRLIHQAASTRDFKQVIVVDPKFRGRNITLSLDVVSAALMANLNVLFRDETNSADIGTAQSIQTNGQSITGNLSSGSNQLTGLSSADVNKLKVGMIICNSNLATATKINAINIGGLSATLSNNSSGNATATTLKISDITIKRKFSFDLPANCSSVSYKISALQESGLPETYIDDIVLQTTESLQNGAVFVTNPDSAVELRTGNNTGSTNIRIRRFTNLMSSLGTDVNYVDSATLGGSFTINTSGIYNITFVDVSTGSGYIGITKNSTQLSTSVDGLSNASEVLASQSSSASVPAECSWSGYLNAGDIIRAHVSTATVTSTTNGSMESKFVISKQGQTKQINPSSDQKIEIPSSEVRLTGSSSRGTSGEALTAQYNVLAKIVGDGLSVNNSNGTVITVTKSGILSVTASLYHSGAEEIHIVKNSTSATDPLASEYGSGQYKSISWTGKVSTGDVFRILCSGTPTANTANTVNFFFEEDKVQVSLSNVLPQWSQSDSAVEVDGTNGVGATNNCIRRFSNIRVNVGSAVTYSDSASLGASFTINEEGLYDISYMEYDGNSATSAPYFGISKNASGTTDAYILNPPELLALARIQDNVGVDTNTISIQVYLLKGDIIRPHVATSSAAPFTSVKASFKISKVGKPNLTSVDVTPFVNMKLQDNHYLTLTTGNGFGSTGTMIRRFSTIEQNTNNGLFKYEDSATNGGSITILKTGYYNISYTDSRGAAGGGSMGLSKNSNSLSTSIDSIATIERLASERVTGTSGLDIASCGWSGYLVAGDIIRAHTSGNIDSSTANSRFSILGFAENDNVVTPLSSFSSDTASFVYAGSGTYTLSTLKDAPVGTFITDTQSSSSNAASQTNAAPTQSVSDMSTNGIIITGRAFSSATSSNTPGRFHIQIGKGFKAISLGLYKATNKTTAGFVDSVINHAGSNQYGLWYAYNENTGILSIDKSTISSGTGFTSEFSFSDLSSQSNAYVTINASKTPTLTALPNLQPRIAYIKDVKTAGTESGSASSGTQTRQLNTLEDPTGIVTSLSSNQFILPAGTYDIHTVVQGLGINGHKVFLYNVTDAANSLIGSAEFASAASNGQCPSTIVGQIVLNNSKTFEIRHYAETARATNGFGRAAGGAVEVYTQVKITKIK